MSRRTTAAEAAWRAREPRLLLVTIEFPDLTLRVAGSPVYVPNSSGEDLQYYGGLTSLDDVTQRSGANQLTTFNFAFSGDGLDMSLMVSDDRVPAAGLVEVAAIWPGDDFSAREVFLQGARITRFNYGRGNEPVALTVQRDDEAECLDIGADKPDLYDIYTSIVENHHELGKLKGKALPIVLGRCYNIPAHRAFYTSSADWVVVAGHPCPTAQNGPGSVAGGGVPMENGGGDTVLTSDYVETPLANTEYTFDGETYTMAEVEGNTGSGSPGTSPTWEVNFKNAYTTAGPSYPNRLTASLPEGGLKDRRKKVIIGAGMILRHLLEESGMRVDWGLQQAALTRLASWDVGLYISQRVNVLELIRDRMIRELPLLEQRSGKGIWFSYHEPWDEPSVATLIEGQHWGMDSAIEYTSLEVRNSITMQYAYHHGNGDFAKSVTVDRTNSGICEWSFNTFRDRPMDRPFESYIAALQPTAVRLARAKIHAMALPKRRFKGVLGREHYWLEPGAVVQVESTNYNLSTRAQIIEKPLSMPGQVTFETIERLPQDRP